MLTAVGIITYVFQPSCTPAGTVYSVVHVVPSLDAAKTPPTMLVADRNLGYHCTPVTTPALPAPMSRLTVHDVNVVVTAPSYAVEAALGDTAPSSRPGAHTVGYAATAACGTSVPALHTMLLDVDDWTTHGVLHSATVATAAPVALLDVGNPVPARVTSPPPATDRTPVAPTLTPVTDAVTVKKTRYGAAPEPRA